MLLLDKLSPKSSRPIQPIIQFLVFHSLKRLSSRWKQNSIKWLIFHIAKRIHTAKFALSQNGRGSSIPLWTQRFCTRPSPWRFAQFCRLPYDIVSAVMCIPASRFQANLAAQEELPARIFAARARTRSSSGANSSKSLHRLQRSVSIAFPALHDGQVDSCLQLRWIVFKDLSPQAHGFAVVFLLRFDQSQVPLGQRFEGICLQRRPVLLRGLRCIARRLLQKSQLSMQHCIPVRSVVFLLRVPEQLEGPLAGRTISSRSHLRIGQAQISIARGQRTRHS